MRGRITVHGWFLVMIAAAMLCWPATESVAHKGRLGMSLLRRLAGPLALVAATGSLGPIACSGPPTYGLVPHLEPPRHRTTSQALPDRARGLGLSTDVVTDAARAEAIRTEMGELAEKIRILMRSGAPLGAIRQIWNNQRSNFQKTQPKAWSISLDQDPLFADLFRTIDTAFHRLPGLLARDLATSRSEDHPGGPGDYSAATIAVARPLLKGLRILESLYAAPRPRKTDHHKGHDDKKGGKRRPPLISPQPYEMLSSVSRSRSSWLLARCTGRRL